MWDWFINFLVWVLETFAGMFGDYGIAIIVMTVIFRLVLTPLTLRQVRSSAKMQVLQPKIQELQDKYGDDPERLNQEFRKFQVENDYNMFSGCLPMLLQWPIFFALFGALRTIAEAHPDAGFLNIMPSIAQTTQGAIAEWGVLGAMVYILFDLLFGAMIVIPTLLSSQGQAPEQRQQSVIMGVVMGVMMVWMGLRVYGGVLLYYNVSSLWGVVQQQLVTKRVMEKAKAEEEARLAGQPVKIDVVRKEKAPRPRKKK